MRAAKFCLVSNRKYNSVYSSARKKNWRSGSSDECTVTVKQFNVLLSKLDFVHFSLVSPQLFVEENEL